MYKSVPYRVIDNQGVYEMRSGGIQLDNGDIQFPVYYKIHDHIYMQRSQKKDIPTEEEEIEAYVP